jgi:hypothetical protein
MTDRHISSLHKLLVAKTRAIKTKTYSPEAKEEKPYIFLPERLLYNHLDPIFTFDRFFTLLGDVHSLRRYKPADS